VNSFLLDAYLIIQSVPILLALLLIASIIPGYIIYLFVKRKTKLASILLAIIILLSVGVLIPTNFRHNALAKLAIKDAHQEYPEFDIKKTEYKSAMVFSDSPYPEHCDILLSKKTNPRIQFTVSFPTQDQDGIFFDGHFSLKTIYNTKYHFFDFTSKAKSGLDEIYIKESPYKEDTGLFEIFQINKTLEGYRDREDWATMINDMVINKTRIADNYFRTNMTKDGSFKIYYLDGDNWILVNSYRYR
jgi:hypothetical protein